MFTEQSIWGALSDASSNNVFWSAVNAGAPSNGTSGTGAGLCGPGSLLIDTTDKALYINTNTLASPTWTLISGGSGGGGVTLNGAQTLTNKTLTAPVVNQPVLDFPEQTVAALGTNQATGGTITPTASAVVYCTTADGTKGVVLPVAAAGQMLIAINNSASILKVYGNATDSATINGTAGTTAYTIAAGASVVFAAPVAAVWYTVPKVSS
jgi:hypothetical protein